MACEISIETTTDRLASCKIMEVGFNLFVCIFFVCVFDHATSVNLLPYSMYEQLGLGELKLTSIILQLVNQSMIVPKDIPHAINTLRIEHIICICNRKYKGL